MPAAAVILLGYGHPRPGFLLIWPGNAAIWADTALTLVWVVGITASFSILDHMDGLCAGVAAVASLFFAIFALESGQLLVSTMAAAVLGAAAGFLRWNFKPAKIFMGDGGAMFLGFLMATLSLKLRPVMAGGHHAAWLVPVFILGATIFDTALISISRSRRGFIPFTTPGKDHTAHRLSNLFHSQRTRGPRLIRARRRFRSAGPGHQPSARVPRLQHRRAGGSCLAGHHRYARARSLRTANPKKKAAEIKQNGFVP